MTLRHYIDSNPLWCHRCHKLTAHNDPMLVGHNSGWLSGPPFWRIKATCVCEYRDKHGWIVAESLLN